MENNFYDEKFYADQAKKSYESAQYVVKLFCDNIFTPASVLDIGAGVGTWLKAWSENGVTKILGFDGNHVDDEFLYIPRKDLKITDLDIIKPNTEKDKYDLVSSLEVAEHLQPQNSKNFIQVLTSYSDVVLFSAALPRQAGVNHINCQPLQFWTDLFDGQFFHCFDIIRPMLLQMEGKVAQWYIQNTLLFVNKHKSQFLIDKGFQPIKTPVQFYHNDIISSHITVMKNQYEDKIYTLKKHPLKLLLSPIIRKLKQHSTKGA